MTKMMISVPMTRLASVLLLLLPMVLSFSDSVFSLKAYQKARAVETAKSLDGSRMHFQILFVDDDNCKGRIAEGLLARIAEHNDALFVLFPASATIESSRNAPKDAAAPKAALRLCKELKVCKSIGEAMGTRFDLGYLDEYDLVVAMDDDIRSLVLRSLPSQDQEYYAAKCRLLSEFLSQEFCTTSDECSVEPEILFRMLETDLLEKVEPVADQLLGRSSSVFSNGAPSGREALAAMVLASAGLTRFCLDTMDAQFEAAFAALLQANFKKREDLGITWEKADDQLRLCSFAVTGYFSPQQRRSRFERHMREMKNKLDASEKENIVPLISITESQGFTNRTLACQ